MKYLIESGESSLSISKEGKSIELELNGEKIAIQGTDLEDFDNLMAMSHLSKKYREYGRVHINVPIAIRERSKRNTNYRELLCQRRATGNRSSWRSSIHQNPKK